MSFPRFYSICKFLDKSSNEYFNEQLSLKITIRHIADELKITPATVSRALSNHPRISAETKQVVKETALRLNYRRNRIASSLRTGKSYAIGVIIPSAKINFFGSIVHGIELIASKSGYHVLLYQSEESTIVEAKAIEAFLGIGVDGILASPAKGNADFSHYKDVRKKKIPLVLFDRADDSLSIPAVVIDDFRGGYYATEHLIQQGYGRIAHLAGPQNLQAFQNRLRGYREALRIYRMPQDENLIYSGDISVESGKKAADYFMDLPAPPDAVFAVEDFSALGLIGEYKSRNINIPEQVGIIGFSNEDFDEFISPALSSIDQQTVEMGREAFVMLLGLMEGSKKQAGLKSKIILEPIPFFRESSKRIH